MTAGQTKDINSVIRRYTRATWRLNLLPCHDLATRQLPHQGLTVRIVAMPKYVIERNIPNAGSLSPEQLQAISQKSCGVLRAMGPQIQWVQSYVTDDKIYCVYLAPDQQAVREHAERGGFPADRISEVRTIIDPTTAETK